MTHLKILFLIATIFSFDGFAQYIKPISSFPSTGGYRGFGYQAGSSYHNGADYAAIVGTEVFAIRDGYVIYSKEAQGFGSLDPDSNGGVIIIRHQNNAGGFFFAVYGHLYRDLAYNGSGQPGEFVSGGQKIGTIRPFTNGGVSLPHLHLGIYSGNSFPTSGWGYSSSLTNWNEPLEYLNNNCGTSLPNNMLGLSSYIMPSIDNLINGSPFSTTISIKNNTSSPWSGDLALALHTNSNDFIANIELKTGQTISAGSTRNFTFSKDQINSVPDDYKLVLKYSKSGNWFNVGAGSYNNPQGIKVIFKMNSALSVTPNPLVSGQAINASVQIRNFSTTNSWTGNIALALHNSSGGFLENIEELTNQTVNANQTRTFQFYKTSINQSAGTFRLVLKMLINGEWQDIAAGNYTNPLSINVAGQTVSTPAFSPSPGTYTSAQNVSLSCATSGATIRYTTNGSEPTSSSAIYSQPLYISSTTTIKAKAFLSGWTESATATGTYTINPISTVATPIFSPSFGTQPITVSINSATSGATIRYTTNGSDPTESSAIYSSSLYFNSSSAVTLKAKAWKSGMNASSVAAVTFSGIQGDGNDVPASATIISSIPHTDNYEINPAGDIDWYRLYLNSSTEYIFANSSASNLDTKFWLYGTGNSGGTNIGQLVASNDDGGGNYQPLINYTASSSGYYYLRVAYYSNAPTEGENSNKKPIGLESTTGSYTLSITTNTQTVATPTFSPSPGYYTSAQYVYLNTSTSGATIRYTTNGSEPTASSPQYSGSIYVSSTTTIKAKAFLSGWTESGTATGIYTIDIIQTVATPTFNPAPGTFSTAQYVYLSTATAGATIRYTTNGSEPMSTSAIYSGALYLASTTTIKAKAFLSGWVDSYTATGTYTISTGLINPCPGLPTVIYGGQAYNTVLIGNQCWLRENLNVGTRINGSQSMRDNDIIEKYCYNDLQSNCDIYGGLYDWREAMQYLRTEGAQGICPPGWHMPTRNEYTTLETFVSGNGNALKAIGQGTGAGAGTNTSGFSALLAGEIDDNGVFGKINRYTYFWSSTESGVSDARRFNLDYNDNSTSLIADDKQMGFSVRCLKEMSEVRLNSPNGGEFYISGSVQNITWSSSFTDNVKLEYTVNNINWIIITPSTSAANGSYAWNIPDASSNYCKIRISSTLYPNIYDLSDAFFTIDRPTVTVTTPNGGEIWRVGTTQNITWASFYVNNVKIEYSTNNGTNWTTIVGSLAANTSLYQWTVPNVPSAQCRIRISDVTNSNVSDLSNAAFTIFYPQITVTSPNGGEQIRAGTQSNINWTANYISSVKIEYTSDNGASWNSIASNVNGSAGTYSWIVPNINSTSCRIKIAETGNSSVFDESNSAFTVFNPQLSLTSPNGYEYYRVGSVKNITWTSSSVSNVKIEYTTNNGSNWITIISSSSAATGVYAWTIPNAVSNNCKVRISDASFPSLISTSLNSFAIYSPVIQLLSPNGGEVLKAKTTHTIQYNYTAFSYLKLEYSTNNGETWNLIAANFGGSQYTWVVPEVSSQNCKIRISDASDPTFFDISDTVFRIKNPSITLLSPNNGAEWPVYSQQTITWSSIDVDTIYIRFRYNENSFHTHTSVTANSGTYTFSVTPLFYTVYNWNKLLYVNLSDNESLFYSLCESDSTIIITNPLKVLYPNGGELIKAGSDVTIRWTEIPDSVILYKGLWPTGGYQLSYKWVTGDSFVWRVPIDSSYFTRVNVTRDLNFSLSDASDTTFFIYRPTLAISSPYPNEKIAVGSNHLINWNSEYLEKVKIEYSTNSGEDWIIITDSTSATTGSYSWNVPNTPSSNCKIRISEVGDPNFVFISNGNFQIYQPVKLLYPDNWVRFLIGSTQQIRWEPTSVSAFRIDYSTNNGNDWLQIAASVSSASGNYNWIVPNTPSNDCRVRIISLDDPASGDTSDYSFNIEGKSIRVNNPNGGDVLVINSVLRVTWQSFGVNNVKIKLWDQNLIWETGILPDSLKSYHWTIPVNLGGNFKIQIVDADEPTINDYSDSAFAISHTGWERVYMASEIPFNTLNAVFAIDSLNITAVGGYAGIYQSTDGGSNWNIKNLDSTAGELFNIKYFDAQKGIASGDNGTIYRTTDGGQTWVKTTVGTNTIYQSVIIDSSAAILVGYEGTVQKTTDFGLSWSTINIGTSQTIGSVHFSDKMNGFLVGLNSTIMKTKNGGESWTNVNTGISGEYYGVYMTDSLCIYVTTSTQSIIKTTDGGITWQIVANLSSGNDNISSPQFLSKDIGYIFTSRRIYKTIDGGSNWTKQFYASSGNTFKYGSHFKDAETGWSTFSGKILLKYKTYLPSMPVLQFPAANGFTSKNINFNWGNAKRAQNFTLQIARDEKFTSGLLEFNTSDTVYLYNQLSNFTKYFWHVRGNNEYGAGDWSITGQFFVSDVPPTPLIEFPPDNSVNIPVVNTPLIWRRIDNQNNVSKYWCQLTTDTMGFYQYNDSTLSDTIVTLQNLQNASTYFWRISAYNLAGWGKFTQWQKFTTVPLPPAQVIPAYPVAGMEYVAQPIKFKWKSVSGAEVYHIQIIENTSPYNIVIDNQNVADTVFLVSSLNNSMSYIWRVRAINAGGTGQWSGDNIFRTLGKPSDVISLNPDNDTYFALPATVEFKWLRSTGMSDSGAIYELNLIDSTSSDVIVTIDSSASHTYFTWGNHNKTINWRVRALNRVGASDWSAIKNFHLKNRPGKPNLVSPLNNSIALTNPVNLNWLATPFGELYKVQVATDSTFNNVVFEVFNVNIYSALFNNAQNYKEYFWRVIVSNGISDTSSVYRFKTLGNPYASNLVVPVNQSVNQPINALTFKWTKAKERIETIQKYQFQLATDTAFASLVFNDTTLTDTLRTINGLSYLTGYYWRVRAQNQTGWGDWSDRWSFTTIIEKPTVPVLAAPLNDAKGLLNPVATKWNKSLRANNYRLQVSVNSGFTSFIVNDSTITDTSKVLPALANYSQYYWRVKAYNVGGESDWSTVFNFKTLGNPYASNLVSPANQSVNQPINVLTFKWTKAKERIETIQKYQFQIATDTTFATLVVNDTTLTDTMRTVNGLTYLTGYYWRVRAQNQTGWGDWSERWSFTTIIEKPTVPVLAAPLNDSKGLLNPITSVWNKSLRAVNYRLQVSDNASFTSFILNDSTLTDTTKVLPSLANYSQYYWRVKSYNVGGESDWSTVFNFKTLGNPYASNLVSPVNQSVNQPVNALTFKWTKAKERIETIQKYQFQLATDTTFTAIVVNDTTLTDTLRNVNGLSYLTGYYWRVRAQNQTGWGDWSERWSFTTIIEKPSVPVLAMPGNNSTMQIQPVIVKWNKSARAERYTLQVSDNPGFTSFIVNDTTLGINDTSKVLPQLAAPKTYHWRLKARNIGGESDFSTVWNFRTLGLPLTVTTVQPAPNSVNQPVANLNFIWRKAGEQTLAAVKGGGNKKQAITEDGEEESSGRNGLRIEETGLTLTSGSVTEGGENILRYWLQVKTDTASGAFFFNDSTLTDTVKNLTGLTYFTEYYWRVKAQNETGWGEYTQWIKFRTIIERPGITVLASPQNNARGLINPVITTWNRSPRAERYRLQLSDNENFATVIINDSTITDTSKTLPTLGNDTQYYWRVKAYNIGGESEWSTAFNFKTLGNPFASNLIEPANQSVNQPVSGVVFKWTKPAERIESILGYQYQLSEDSLFGTTVVNDTTLTDTVRTVSGLTTLTTYYWRVRARNQAGWGDWSSRWSLTTIISAPGQVTLVSPANNEADQSVRPLFMWNRVQIAERYRFEIASDQNFQNIVVLDTMVTDTAKNLTADLNWKTKYYWRVRAANIGGTGSYSSVFSFTTQKQPVAAPSNLQATWLLNGRVRLQWSDNSANEAGFIIKRKLGDSLSANQFVVIDSAGSGVVESFDSTALQTTLYTYQITAFTIDSMYSVSNMAILQTGTGVKDDLSGKPKEFSLYQNYPNPFNPSTVIRFAIPMESMVEITVYSLGGEVVADLMNEMKQPGYYELNFDALSLASGIYLYRIKAVPQGGGENYISTKKLILVK